MPLMPNIAHDERMVERDTANRKNGPITEEGGLDVLDGEWAYLPIVGLQPDTIQPAAIAGNGVANAPSFEVPRRLGQ